MPELGPWLLWLAALTTIYSIAVLSRGLRLIRQAHQLPQQDGAAMIDSGHNAVLATTGLLTLASGLLFYNLFTSNFRVEYVASYTSRELPLLYKLSAFWGGQNGSLLLWAWLLSLLTTAVLLIHRRRNLASLPYVSAILMAILLFFETMLLFIAQPFAVLDRTPANGVGLSPLLQHPAMAAHPPLLYLGYGGYVVHFGIVLIFVGIAGTAFEERTDATVAAGESFTLGRYKVEYVGFSSGQDEAKQWIACDLKVSIDGNAITTLRPEKRLYVTHEQPSTEVALHSTWRDDLYIVLAGYDYDKKVATFSAHVNPLVRWLWIGGWVMAAGTLLALIPLTRESKPVTTAAQWNGHGLDRNKSRRVPTVTVS